MSELLTREEYEAIDSGGFKPHYEHILPYIEAQQAKVPALFQLGSFTLHSGSISKWKINCDALRDWEAVAYMIQEVVLKGRKFGKVIGVPTGGQKLAKALEQYATEGATLIVDDVLTTGKSMERMKATCEGEVIGVVVFARNECPIWIQPLFSMKQKRLDGPDREKIERILDRLLFSPGESEDGYTYNLTGCIDQLLALLEQAKLEGYAKGCGITTKMFSEAVEQAKREVVREIFKEIKKDNPSLWEKYRTYWNGLESRCLKGVGE